MGVWVSYYYFWQWSAECSSEWLKHDAVQPRDEDALAKKLEILISDDDRRVKLTEGSGKLAMSKFSLNALTEQMVEIYEELK